MRRSYVRISTKDPYRWFIDNFGIGGMENYTAGQAGDIMYAMKLLLENCGSVELEFVGKTLIQLSDNPSAINKFHKKLSKFDDKFGG